MHLKSQTLTTVLLALLESCFAAPAIDYDIKFPDSVSCGPLTDPLQGLPGIGPPDYDDLIKSAERLAKKGGACTTPEGDGKCVRVACNNTTGIYFCNSDGKNGPFSVDCKEVAAYVYRGEDTARGSGDQVKTIWSMCQNRGMYAINLVSGQAFDDSGDWTIITGYANCNHDPVEASENPSSLK